jgi:hypothetical protein
MIGIPEILIVTGVFALMSGYIGFLRRLLSDAAKKGDSDSNPVRCTKS